MVFSYHVTFDDYRQAQRGHVASRGGTGFRMTILAVAVALSVGIAGLLAVTPARLPPAGRALYDLAVALALPFAPWLLLTTHWLGVLLIRQRPPRARVIDVARQTRPRWVTLGGVTVCAVVATTLLGLAAQGLLAAAPSQQSATERVLAVGLPMIPYVLVLLFLWLFVFRRMVRRAYDADRARFDRITTATASADRVTFDDVLTTLSYRWPAFARCVEAADLFLLYPTQGTMFIVPKRAFASANDVAAFRRLVDEWADSHAAGFPVVPTVAG